MTTKQLSLFGNKKRKTAKKGKTIKVKAPTRSVKTGRKRKKVIRIVIE